MYYKRKTRDVFIVQGKYSRWENLTYEDSRSEAIAMKKCYDDNEPYVSHRIVSKRRLILEVNI